MIYSKASGSVNALTISVKQETFSTTTNSGGNATLCDLSRIPLHVSVARYIAVAYLNQAGKYRNVNVKTTEGTAVANTDIEVTYWYIDDPGN